MTVRARLALLVPAGWRLVDLGGDKSAAVADAVDQAFASADRDSSAVGKHWMRERLTAAAAAGNRSEVEVVAIGYPEHRVAGVVLPLTLSVLRLGRAPVDEDDPMTTLALLASRDRSSRPVPTADALALRTHAVVDQSEAFTREVCAAPVQASERSRILHATGRLPTLNVRYTLPPLRSEHWHVISVSALLGGDEGESLELAGVYLDLCDSLVSAVRWEPTTGEQPASRASTAPE